MDYLLMQGALSAPYVLTDEHLAVLLHCQLKQVHRLVGYLRSERLLRMGQYTVSSTSSASSNSKSDKPINKTYIYIDYKQAVSMIRWRLDKMRMASEARLREDLERKGYKCGQCGHKWSPLEVHHLKSSDSGFICDNCEIELIDDDSSAHDKNMHNAKKPTEFHSLLMDTLSPIVALLRKIKVDEIPTFNANELIRRLDNKQESPAPAPSPTPPNQVGVSVELPLENQPSNPSTSVSLPIWHTHSTVTGERIKDDAKRTLESLESPVKRQKSIEIVFDADDNQSDDGNDEDVVVSVQGVNKRFAEITEDDKRMMTSDEYERYFDHYLAIQGGS